MMVFIMNTVVEYILFYSDKLADFDYGEGHPFKPSRAKQMFELMNRYSLIFEENQKIIEPPVLDEKLLTTFHSSRYIKLLQQCNKGDFNLEMLQSGIGNPDNPVVAGMYDYALAAAGGTCEGARLLLNNEARIAFNPHGGFHHAGRDYAEGFCYINDIALAITQIIQEGRKVAYIDIDAHHGNGVQDAFYADDRVLTISLHESGKTLYPWGGTENELGIREGHGYNVNIPFLQGTDDDIYIDTFNAIVPPLLEAYGPHIIHIEIGGDAHRDDPLAHLNLTTHSYEHVLGTLRDKGLPILATGGGGYNVHKTAALWALAWATLCNLPVEDSFAGLVGGMMYGPEKDTGSLRDGPFSITDEEKQTCLDHAQKIASYIKETVFPLHGI